MMDLIVRSVDARGDVVVAGGATVCLKKENLLPSCLGIHDGVAIQTKGIETFRAMSKHLDLGEIYLWRSVVSDSPYVTRGIFFDFSEGYLPLLKEADGEVVIEWRKFSDCHWWKFVDTVHFTTLLPKLE
jgi:hypothetical protein